jgi:hypothetical protein
MVPGCGPGRRDGGVRPSAPAAVATNALFPHIIHVGAIIKDRALEDTFYRDILGFRPIGSAA